MARSEQCGNAHHGCWSALVFVCCTLHEKLLANLPELVCMLPQFASICCLVPGPAGPVALQGLLRS